MDRFRCSFVSRRLELPGNWLGGVPTASDDVLIPAGLTTAYPYRNLLSALAPSNIKTLEIENGAMVN
ncbi:MAG: hypothetical protein IPF54_23930 [Draconibacterium sp.]|nr:hypothetical protein [Draconibacterium sp.]